MRSVRPPRIQSRRPGPGDLRRDIQAIALLPRQPGAEILFGAPLGLRVRRHRIHLRGVDEVDALRERVVELLVRLGFAVLLAPGHRAEADLGDVQLGAGKRSVLHGGLRSKQSHSVTENVVAQHVARVGRVHARAALRRAAAHRGARARRSARARRRIAGARCAPLRRVVERVVERRRASARRDRRRRARGRRSSCRSRPPAAARAAPASARRRRRGIRRRPSLRGDVVAIGLR